LHDHHDQVQQVLGQGGWVLLDGIDDALEAVRSQIAAWLAEYTRARVIVTGTCKLRMVAESVLHVGPLRATAREGEALSPAVSLYCQRCRALNADWRAPTSLDVVKSLVDATHGVPLLVELVAQRSLVVDPHELVLTSNEWLDLLVSTQLDRETTQLSVRAGLSRTYAALTASQQRLWQRCATFAGSFTKDAVKALGLHEPAAGQLSSAEVALELEQLLERSLLSPATPSATTNEPAVGGAPRLMVMKHLRQFALEQAEAEGQRGTLYKSHASWIGARAEAALQLGDYSDLWVDLPELELALQVQAHLSVALSLSLSACVLHLFSVRGSFRDFQRVEPAILAALTRVTDDTEARVAQAACEVASLVARTYVRYGVPDDASRVSGSIEHLVQRAARTEAAARIETDWWQVKAAIARARGDSEEAERAYVRALEVNQSVRENALTEPASGPSYDSRHGEVTLLKQQRAMLLSQYASWQFEHGRVRESELNFKDALALHRGEPGAFALGVTLNNWALVLQHSEQWEMAEDLITQSLVLHRQTGHRRFEAIAHGDLGLIALERGNFSLAARHGGIAARRLTALGDEIHAQLAEAARLLAAALAGEDPHVSATRATGRQHYGGDDYQAALAVAGEIYADMADWVRELDATRPAARLWAAIPGLDERSLIWSARTTALAARCDELRLAVRVATRCHEWCCASTGTLVVSNDCTRGRMPDGLTFDLSDKPALAALLRRLVLARLDRERPELSIEALVAVAWPGEKISESAAKNRLHVALSKLRTTGLGAALVTTKGGYALATDLPVLTGRVRPWLYDARQRPH
jgi:tetratricopeptide (TPR) repeat protein